MFFNAALQHGSSRNGQRGVEIDYQVTCSQEFSTADTLQTLFSPTSILLAFDTEVGGSLRCAKTLVERAQTESERARAHRRGCRALMLQGESDGHAQCKRKGISMSTAHALERMMMKWRRCGLGGVGMPWLSVRRYFQRLIRSSAAWCFT
eukprot:3563761-Pleurochrysis_carterae.AAC.4